MVKVDVDPGVCGMPATINIKQSGPMAVDVALQSTCQHVDSMNRELRCIDAYHECFKMHHNSQILEMASKYCQHFSCPIPIAIIKGIEVEVGISKPKDITIKISQTKVKQ